VKWLRSAAIIAQKDLVAGGYLTKDEHGRIRLPPLTGAAVAEVQVLLRKIAGHFCYDENDTVNYNTKFPNPDRARGGGSGRQAGLVAMFRKQSEQARAGSRTNAAFGDQSCHEPRWSHVEGVVCGRAMVWCEPDGNPPPFVAPTLDMRDLAAIAPLDRDLCAVLDLPIDAR